MFEYIEGKIVELTPTYIVIDNKGIGYLIHISLNTYSALMQNGIEKILLHQVIKEDAHLLYGFKESKEREVFRLLISVSGIGANTARMILSSMKADELANAIVAENIRILQGIKGIGAKTAQRMVVELKDKMVKFKSGEQNFALSNNTSRDEAFAALLMLGFAKPQVEKALSQVYKDSKDATVEEAIKMALKLL